MDIEKNYLTNIPQSTKEFGLCKVLNVRNEVIHFKHILTEIFVRKTIDVSVYLNYIGMDLFQYMEIMTNRLRTIHKFTRKYIVEDVNDIVKEKDIGFFPSVEFLSGHRNVIVLDFDGVVTSKKFEQLYSLCVERCKTVICTANPTVTEEWFIKKGYPLPHKIYANKGAKAKIRNLIEIQKKHDFAFFVDNEEKYLAPAWTFGIKTFIFADGKIKNYSLNSK